MRVLRPVLAIALLGGCVAERPIPSPSVVSAELGIFRAAELARVRCLIVAPFENASNSPLAAEVATGAVLSGLSASGTRVFPVKELRALFRDTPVELPEGVPPGLAMELAQLVGADAAIYGTIEGTSGRADPGLIVSVRLALSPQRELLYATTFAVAPRRGETAESAVRRTLSETTNAMIVRLGNSRGGSCFDRHRLDSLRALALAEGTPKPAPPPPVPAPEPAPVPTPRSTPPHSAPLTAHQKDFAQRLARREQFIVDDVAFKGRTAQLQRDSGLADLAFALVTTPDAKVKIEGHVDTTNDPVEDAQLSTAMAQAAADRLAELGVPRERIQVEGRGSDSPRLPNFTVRGRTANRRIEAVGLK
jgi:outer membrane protein OmpA-like peptidoglycan-associated protein